MNFRRLFDIFPYQQAKFPQKRALSGKSGMKWSHYSTAECIQAINRVSAGLLKLGLKPGDAVGIMTPIGSPQWNFLDLGMQQIGVIVIPIHASISVPHLKFIISDANLQYCMIEDEAQHEKLAPIFQQQNTTLKGIYSIKKVEGIPDLNQLMQMPSEAQLATIEMTKASIQETDLTTIIYTSGTTGQPKGVMLSHKNLVSNIKSIIPLIPINCDKRAVSFLPLSHIFERMVTYTYMAVGTSVYYAERVDQLLEVVQDVKPQYFTAVPRILEKMNDGIRENILQRHQLIQRLFNWSIALGERYNGRKDMTISYWLKLKIADLLVFRAWRKMLGGQVEGIVVGAAALKPQLGRLYSAAGLEIREGYGLTETSPVIAFNRFEPGGVRFGTVGIPVPGVNVKINPIETGKEDGEILVKGPNVMLGYYKLNELTQSVIDESGWFHTGDVGKIVHKRFLKITDRKKDIFKTSRGKYIAPQPIENLLQGNIYIDTVMIVGFNRPFITALIYPSYPQVKKWCLENQVHWTAPQFMAIHPKVLKFMSSIIDQVNTQLSGNEQIKGFHLLHEPWTIESGELTPTLKVKRSVIEEKHQKTIDELYLPEN